MSRSSTPELRFDANGDPIYRASTSTPANRRQRSRSSSAARPSTTYDYYSRSYSPTKSSASPVYAGDTTSRTATPGLRFDMAGNVIERTGTAPPTTRGRADSNRHDYSRASTSYNTSSSKTTASAYWASQSDDNAIRDHRSDTPALRFDFHGNVIPRSANATPATRVRGGSNAQHSRAPTPQWNIDHYAVTTTRKGRGKSTESDSWDMHGKYLGNLSNSSGGTRPRRSAYSRRSSSDSSRRSSASKKGDAHTSMFDSALAYSDTYSRPGTRVKFDTPRPPSTTREYGDPSRDTSTPFKIASARSHSPAYDIWGNLILQPNTEDEKNVEKRERVISRTTSPVIMAPKPRRPFKVFEAEDNPVEEDTSSKILSAVAAHSMNISPEYDIMGNLLSREREQDRRISPQVTSRPPHNAPTPLPAPALSAEDRYAVVVQTMPDLLRNRRYYDTNTLAKPVRSASSSSASSASSSSSAAPARVIRPTPSAVSGAARPRKRSGRRSRHAYHDRDEERCAMM